MSANDTHIIANFEIDSKHWQNTENSRSTDLLIYSKGYERGFLDAKRSFIDEMAKNEKEFDIIGKIKHWSSGTIWGQALNAAIKRNVNEMIRPAWCAGFCEGISSNNASIELENKIKKLTGGTNVVEG